MQFSVDLFLPNFPFPVQKNIVHHKENGKRAEAMPEPVTAHGKNINKAIHDPETDGQTETKKTASATMFQCRICSVYI